MIIYNIGKQLRKKECKMSVLNNQLLATVIIIEVTKPHLEYEYH